jgi:hypothetical protein
MLRGVYFRKRKFKSKGMMKKKRALLMLGRDHLLARTLKPKPKPDPGKMTASLVKMIAKKSRSTKWKKVKMVSIDFDGKKWLPIMLLTKLRGFSISSKVSNCSKKMETKKVLLPQLRNLILDAGFELPETRQHGGRGMIVSVDDELVKDLIKF